MSLARPYLWRYEVIGDEGTGAGTGGTIWHASGFAPMTDVNEGETVIRTRLQISLSYGWQANGDDPPNALPQLWYQNMIIQVGLYARPDLDVTGTPPSPAGVTSDGNWIMNDMLTPRHIRTWYDTMTTNTQAEVNFQMDSGTGESFAKRGPFTVGTGSVFLCWDVFSPVNFWLQNSAAYVGWNGGVARLSTLVQTA